MARMGVASAPGAGIISLGTAVSGYQTFAAAGALDGEIFSYNLSDFDSSGNLIAWEVGSGTYAASGPTLTRTPLFSSNANAAIAASALAEVWLTALATDFAPGPYQSYIVNTAVKTWQTGAVFDNYGATGSVILTLPAWQKGLVYSFVVAVAQTLTIAPNGSDRVGSGAALFSTFGSGQLYASLTLETSNLPGVWIARSMTGGWDG